MSRTDARQQGRPAVPNRSGMDDEDTLQNRDATPDRGAPPLRNAGEGPERHTDGSRASGMAGNQKTNRGDDAARGRNAGGGKQGGQ